MQTYPKYSKPELCKNDKWGAFCDYPYELALCDPGVRNSWPG